jgi:hypothetical protein
MKLKQYRKEDWPFIDSFAIGILQMESKDWGVAVCKNSSLIEAEISSPFGGYYFWFRNW